MFMGVLGESVVKALGLQTALEIVLNLVNLRDLQIVELGLSNLICVVSLMEPRGFSIV